MTASAAAAQSTDTSAPLADLGDDVASAGRDAVLATDRAARVVQEHMEDAWTATIAREPDVKLRLLPDEVPRPPKPRVAARPQSVPPGSNTPGTGGKQHALTGIASYYWQGETTASGEPFDKRAMTAAHPSLPFGTRVRVFCANTGRQVVVRINDRGPFKPGRVIDLSEAAAEAIGMQGRGLTTVQLEVMRN